LHLLHIYPARASKNIFLAQNYEFLMSESIKSFPESTECVIFRTTSTLALSKLHGDYVTYWKLYNDKNQKTIQNCVNEYYDDYEICEKAIFTNNGVQWLNEKMRKFVSEYKSENGPKLVLMDSNFIYTHNSKYTDDGRHYTKIKNLEVALLIETIEEKCGFHNI